jgi:hypothetical protein
MISPGSSEDWTLFTGLLGSLWAFALYGYRWVLLETVTSERMD